MCELLTGLYLRTRLSVTYAGGLISTTLFAPSCGKLLLQVCVYCESRT